MLNISAAKAEKISEHLSHIKQTGGDIVFNILNYLFFGLFTLSCIFPFYYIFINTISSRELVARGLITFYPRELTISNYIALGNVNDIWRSFGITVLRTVIGTATTVFASALAGYLMTKKELWCRKVWYRVIVVTMYFNAGLIPIYMNLSTLNLTDSFWVYIIPCIVSPYNIILVKTYIESIPGEIEESAYLDGAGYWVIFRRIIWPLSKPIPATIAIFGAVGHWNSFRDSLICNANSPELYTLRHRLYVYLNSSSNLSALMNGASSSDSAALSSLFNSKVIQYTISMVTIIPILLVYPFMQRYFEKGIMLGAVKG